MDATPTMTGNGGCKSAGAPRTGGCRACGSALHSFVDLGVSPLCESFLAAEDLDRPELFYPLDVKICPRCWLAQLQEYVSPQAIFSDYAYFSSFSTAWLAHARDFVDLAVTRFGLGPSSFVIEVASNDGYLLKNVVDRHIPCLGIEPAANVARAAEAMGVPTEVAFFGNTLARQLADRGQLADLIVANNVLAQVPDLNDFVAGLRTALAWNGVVSIEVPHLLRLIEGNQFDTIYHEHFSYFSLASIECLLANHDLRVFDIEELWTHGGSLRLFCCARGSAHHDQQSVARIRAMEADAGMGCLATYESFSDRVAAAKHRLLNLLIDIKRTGQTIVGYGAPGKGNTLLNYCGIRTDLIDFTVDRNPHKHGRYLPGTRIPIFAPDRIDMLKPDYVLILPWNLKQEIMVQMAHIHDWGGRFIVPIPEPVILDGPRASLGVDQ